MVLPRIVEGEPWQRGSGARACACAQERRRKRKAVLRNSQDSINDGHKRDNPPLARTRRGRPAEASAGIFSGSSVQASFASTAPHSLQTSARHAPLRVPVEEALASAAVRRHVKSRRLQGAEGGCSGGIRGGVRASGRGRGGGGVLHPAAAPRRPQRRPASAALHRCGPASQDNKPRRRTRPR